MDSTHDRCVDLTKGVSPGATCSVKRNSTFFRAFPSHKYVIATLLSHRPWRAIISRQPLRAAGVAGELHFLRLPLDFLAVSINQVQKMAAKSKAMLKALALRRSKLRDDF